MVHANSIVALLRRGSVYPDYRCANAAAALPQYPSVMEGESFNAVTFKAEIVAD
jgi:hypothetical protein